MQQIAPHYSLFYKERFMKASVYGMVFVLVLSGLAFGDDSAYFTGQPKNVVTLNSSNGYSFTGEYNWMTETSSHAEILGSWANSVWAYTDVRQYTGYGNMLNLRNSPRGSLIYQVVVPVSDAEITVDAMIRRGLTVRVRPNAEADFYANPVLFSNNTTSWVTGSSVVPPSLLDTSVPGQVSFQVQIMNESSDFAGGLFSVGFSAVPVPEPLSLGLLATGAVLGLRRKK
jgi:hypothetical protein